MNKNGGLKRITSMIVLILVVFLSGCKTNKDINVVDESNKEKGSNNELVSRDDIVKKIALLEPIELEEIPSDFTLQDAKDAEMLVIENMVITSGLSRWNTFLNNVNFGLTDTIYIGKYYEIGDKAQYSPELYEEIKDDYPMLFISKLFYDGEKYTLQYYNESKLYTYEYAHLLERIGWSKNASVAAHIVVIANQEDFSYRDIIGSMISSSSEAWIDYQWIFNESVTLEEYNRRKPGVYKTENGLASLTLDENCRFSFNRNIATSYDPRGRYYVEKEKIILYVSEEEEYSFGMVGDGTLEFLSGEYAEGLVPIGTKFYIEP